MKTILIPSDFSECANNALRFAAFMATKTGATLNLLHVLDVPLIGYQGSIEGTVNDVPYMMGILKATKTRMKKLLKSSFLKDIKVNHNIEIGSVTDQIMKAAEKYKAELIVMGTHGAKGVEEIFIGSTAEKIVHNSQIPVITIKHEITEPKIEKIVYATDFSDECESVFPEVEKIAKMFEAKIEVVKVVTRFQFETSKKSARTIEKFKKKFQNSDFPVSVYNDFNKQEGIRRYSDSAGANMIALGTHGRHGLSHFFNRSIAEDLVNHSSLPILTVNLKPTPINASLNKAEENEKNKAVLSSGNTSYMHQIFV